MNVGSVYGFFLGWTVILTLLTVATRLESTRRITYYILWLSIVFLIVTHYQDLNEIIAQSGVVVLPDIVQTAQAQS